MKKLNLIILPLGIITLLLIGCGGTINYQDIPVPPLDWTPMDYEEFSLDNGIDGLVVEDNEVPLVDFYFLFPSPPDPTDKVGLAEMVAWSLRNGGSENYPADSLNSLLEYKAARISVSAGQELLYISGSCLKNDLDLMLGIIRDMIENPVYPNEKIEFKRATMLEDIRRSNENPGRIAFREMYRLIYPDHPLGLNNSISTVSSITREDVTEYHAKVFQTEDAVLGFAGDISTMEAENVSSQHFGDYQAPKVEIEKLPAINPAADPGIYYGFKEINQAYVVLGHQTIRYDDPRRPAADMMNHILGGGGFQAILMKRIRVDQGLAYSVFSSFSTSYSNKGRFIAFASTRLEEAGRTLNTLDQEIRNYVENGPTQEQFENAKQSYINSYVWDFESAQDILSRLVYLKWRGMPLDAPQRDLEAYQNLTIEDIRQVAKELIHPDEMIKVVIGDQSKMNQPLSDFGEVTEIDISVEQN